MTGPDIAPALFERAKAGDRRAMDVVLAALRPSLIARAEEYLRKFPDDSAADAEDVAQDGLLKVWQHFKEIESVEKLLPFAMKLALNTAKDARKSNHRRRDRVVASSPIAEIAGTRGRGPSDLGEELGDGNYHTPARGSESAW